VIGSTGNFDQREFCHASNPPCEAIFSRALLVILSAAKDLFPLPGSPLSAPRFPLPVPAPRSRSPLPVSRSLLVILSAAMDLVGRMGKILHFVQNDKTQRSHLFPREQYMAVSRQSAYFVGNVACPVPPPVNWISVHAEGVEPLPYSTFVFIKRSHLSPLPACHPERSEGSCRSDGQDSSLRSE